MRSQELEDQKYLNLQEEQSDWSPPVRPQRIAFTRADRLGLVLLWAVLMVLAVAVCLGLRDMARWFF